MSEPTRRRSSRTREELDEDETDDRPRTRTSRAGPRRRAEPPRVKGSGKRPARTAHGPEGLMEVLHDLVRFVKLLGGLALDKRVSAMDKGIVLATIAYVVSPLDFVPDFIPFLGQFDDLYLVMLTVTRLLRNAGDDVVMEHWDGDRDSLRSAMGAVERVAEYLPKPIRKRLLRRVR